MRSLNHYLSLTAHGNPGVAAAAAFEAAKIMYNEKYNEVIVQAMLRKSGELGDVNAQRWLGFIGLTNRLIDPVSTTSNIIYYKDASVAYQWFKKAADKGDLISTFAVYKCLQHGIGVTKNLEKAEHILDTIADKLSFDVLPFMFFFDAYHEPKTTAHTIEYQTTLRNLLAS